MNSEQPAYEPAAGETQQGVAYPPPPSYYENMQLPAEPLPLPEKQPGAHITQPISGVVSPSAATTAPGPYYRPAPTGRQPSYTTGHYPHPAMMSPTRTSHRQTWVIMTIIGVSVLLLVSAGIWAVANIYGGVSQQGVSANQVAQDFYQHMLQQDYSGAYADLQINGLTASAFTHDAQSVDARYGQVASFNIDATSLNSANPTSTATHLQITVHVTRPKTTYSVQIPLDNINGGWKITGLDLSKF
jgi:ABC-type multidrug transport system fused ATPase/permease subunit